MRRGGAERLRGRLRPHGRGRRGLPEPEGDGRLHDAHGRDSHARENLPAPAESVREERRYVENSRNVRI